jgi:hypothetical protein
LLPSRDVGLHSLIALGAAAASLWKRSARTYFLLLWAFVPFLYLNFGSSSIKIYLPLPAGARYLTPIYMPLFLMAGIVLSEWSSGGYKKQMLTAGLLAIACPVGIMCAVRTRGAGWRTNEIARLKQIAVSERQQNRAVCSFTGKDAQVWRESLQILAPELTHCPNIRQVTLIPDLQGLPIEAETDKR